MLWDIFCRVIDNHGDLGVCWRLSADLANRGHTVRLWVDDVSALAWMAPESLRRFHLRWNDLSQDPLPQVDLASWQACALAARERLVQQMDLVSQLLQFVAEKR